MQHELRDSVKRNSDKDEDEIGRLRDELKSLQLEKEGVEASLEEYRLELKHARQSSKRNTEVQHASSLANL